MSNAAEARPSSDGTSTGDTSGLLFVYCAGIKGQSLFVKNPPVVLSLCFTGPVGPLSSGFDSLSSKYPDLKL